jgi:hypothetical protein
MDVKTDTERLLASKVKGKKWAEAALPVLVGISRRVKEIEAKTEDEKDEIDPAGIVRLSLAAAGEKYKPELGQLASVDAFIRERVMKEYTDTETITKEEGELVFPMSKIKVEVTNIKKVEEKFLTVDHKAVVAEFKNGVAKFKGIEVTKERTMQVRPRKAE